MTAAIIALLMLTACSQQSRYAHDFMQAQEAAPAVCVQFGQQFAAVEYDGEGFIAVCATSSPFAVYRHNIPP